MPDGEDASTLTSTVETISIRSPDYLTYLLSSLMSAPDPVVVVFWDSWRKGWPGSWAL